MYFAVTPAGRYLLGEADKLEWEAPAVEAQIVLQPNFEVVFMAPSPQAEIEFARFAERVGAGMGTLFRITKKSIFSAAGAGMTAAEVQASLAALSTNEPPKNVVREIGGWFDQCRRVTCEPTVLIRCPDKPTALRVIAALGKSARPLGDTIVEMPGKTKRPAAIKKLEAQGIFLE